MAAPHLVNINPLDVPSLNVGFQTTQVARDNSYGGGWVDSSQTLNDYIEWPVHLAAGTWRVTLFHATSASSGIVHVDIDGVEVGTVDFYSGSTVFDVVNQISGITVASDGVVPLRLAVDTKNASSSAYRAILQHICLMRTGA